MTLDGKIVIDKRETLPTRPVEEDKKDHTLPRKRMIRLILKAKKFNRRKSPILRKRPCSMSLLRRCLQTMTATSEGDDFQTIKTLDRPSDDQTRPEDVFLNANGLDGEESLLEDFFF